LPVAILKSKQKTFHMIGKSALPATIDGSNTNNTTATNTPRNMSATDSANILAGMMALAANKQSGIIDLRNGEVIELYDKPRSTLITSVGKKASDSSALAVSAFAFNTSVYNKTIGQDGTTAAISETYNDGIFQGVSGNNINQHINFANAGRGLQMKQVTFTGVNSDGQQDITVLEAMEFTIQSYTSIGGKTLPKVYDISEAIRNTQYQSGILTLLIDAWISSVTQLNWQVPAGATVTANITWY
jgi:hypothetical protein